MEQNVKTLTTCLWFNYNGREAAEYYVALFPNSRLNSNWITKADTPGNQANTEVVVNFEIFGQPQICPAEMNKYLGGPDPEGSRRATEAMLKMRKIDLEAMRLAYEG